VFKNELLIFHIHILSNVFVSHGFFGKKTRYKENKAVKFIILSHADSHWFYNSRKKTLHIKLILTL